MNTHVRAHPCGCTHAILTYCPHTHTHTHTHTHRAAILFIIRDMIPTTRRAAVTYALSSPERMTSFLFPVVPIARTAAAAAVAAVSAIATRDCTKVDLCDGKPADIYLLRQTFSWVQRVSSLPYIRFRSHRYLAKSAVVVPIGRRPINRFRKSRFREKSERSSQRPYPTKF